MKINIVTQYIYLRENSQGEFIFKNEFCLAKYKDSFSIRTAIYSDELILY